MDDPVPPKLLSCLSSAADAVREHDDIHIFSHHDADGISAAIILSKTIMRIGKGYKLTLLGALNRDTIEEVKNCGAKCIIIADMGVSYMDELETIDAEVVVLDHHKGDPFPKRVRYMNPHSFGIDGMSGGCGASMAMLFSLAMDENNWDLVRTAFAGITGDKQHHMLTDINRYLFDEGSRRGFVSRTDGKLIPPGQLMRSLFFSLEPYIGGVSGDADGVAALLGDAGIDTSLSSEGLSDSERRKLTSLIASKLLSQGVTKETMDELTSVRYSLKDMSFDSETYASYLNSCGRSGKGGTAVGLGLGDKKCLADAAAADEDAKKRIIAAVREIERKGLVQMDNIQCFENTEPGFTGILCETVMRYIGVPHKPTVGYNISDGTAKASSRCTHRMLETGIDLSVAMKAAGEAAGGSGGGHRIASGGWFPAGREKDFLEALDRAVGEQITAR